MLLERASALGGRARTDIQAGHAFNLGAHALYVDGPAFRGLRELGVTFSGRPPPTSGLLGLARGELHRFPAGLLSMIATDLFGVGGKIDAARALATLARTDPRPLRDVPWGEWLQRVVPRAEVRDAVHALARVTTYANAPQRASAGATIAQVKRGISPGVLYLDGGWQTLVDGLEAAAIAAGVRVLRGARVTSLVGDDCARGVIADGERIAARAVLLATGPAAAQTLIGGARRTLTNGADLLTLCAQSFAPCRRDRWRAMPTRRLAGVGPPGEVIRRAADFSRHRGKRLCFALEAHFPEPSRSPFATSPDLPQPAMPRSGWDRGNEREPRCGFPEVRTRCTQAGRLLLSGSAASPSCSRARHRSICRNRWV